jgi:GTP-binding protein LepA
MHALPDASSCERVLGGRAGWLSTRLIFTPAVAVSRSAASALAALGLVCISIPTALPTAAAFQQSLLTRGGAPAGFGVHSDNFCGRPRCGRSAALGLRMQQKKSTELMTREERLKTAVSQNAYQKVESKKIRNFSIIAHIDHGKSTLADRLLQKTGTVASRDMQNQLLDNMDIERERGITIKLQAARMNYKHTDGEDYVLNLIDTPGHVDFSYEVSRSLMACEAALLVVDASQGIEAQTLANVYLAIESDLEIIPILNKIDLPGADPEKVKAEIEAVIGIDTSNAVECSAKSGLGIEEVLAAIVEHTPAPKPDQEQEKLRCLIFDSYYDPYRGVITYFRVMQGRISRGDKIRFMNTGKSADITEVGVLSPKESPVDFLEAGEVGYMMAGIKSVEDARVGDTITLESESKRATKALPGYAEAKPMVWCGMFPTDAADYDSLRDSLGKLKLNDAALQVRNRVKISMKNRENVY